MATRTETKLGLTFGWKPGDGSGAAQTPNWHSMAAWVQARVLSVVTEPPGSPDLDAAYLVAAVAASGPFTGQEGRVAWNNDGVWLFFVAQDGFKVFVIDQDKTLKYNVSLGAWENDSIPSVNSPSGNRTLMWSAAAGQARWTRASEAVSELDSVLAYSSGQLSTITYSDGTTKTFSYTGDVLSSITWVRENDTLVKTFAYSGDDLVGVTVVVTP